MKYLFTSVVLLISFFSLAQTNEEIIQGIETYHASENEKFGTVETTILTEKDFKDFEQLEFYPIDVSYRVKAEFIRTPNEEPFLMPTTTERLPEYVKYGEAHFTIEGKDLKLNLYKSTEPYNEPGYEDYLFLPFTDLTSGDGSYGGGRFLDARIPEGDTIVLDFNKAYNPYCAYNSRYSCPIPPEENDLLVRIEAGVKAFDKH
ncbi:DUF1684 domain-containing protein [Marixanthomonas ophiurae]|uniref:DUF1684 domain-containing protein n=1 Tax=Marixanthomonas ophiurae TaxID=387659 RepID=A0A3E1QCZ3_9FLAO|nr:DUF1684 domain-containing protein [Marixanthomonas ophiurae]RFN59977.1 DUF1684 domain-containing protein [Marixanthomonas ophiurae]